MIRNTDTGKTTKKFMGRSLQGQDHSTDFQNNLTIVLHHL